MSLKIYDDFSEAFVSAEEVQNLANQAKGALQTVKDKTGAGSDFLGWYSLPSDYDKDEFNRIKIAAEKIKSNSQILIY